MIVRKALLMLVSIIMVTSAFSAVVLITRATQSTDEPIATVEIHSDYIVSIGEIIGVDNANWLMKANIRVNSGGTLYINNSFIKWDCTTDGQYGMFVAPGASLNIRGSNFTVNDTTTRHDRGTKPAPPQMDSWDITYGFLGFCFCSQ